MRAKTVGIKNKNGQKNQKDYCMVERGITG